MSEPRSAEEWARVYLVSDDDQPLASLFAKAQAQARREATESFQQLQAQDIHGIVWGVFHAMSRENPATIAQTDAVRELFRVECEKRGLTATLARLGGGGGK